jgi:hypothetical protein
MPPEIVTAVGSRFHEFPALAAAVTTSNTPSRDPPLKFVRILLPQRVRGKQN